MMAIESRVGPAELHSLDDASLCLPLSQAPSRKPSLGRARLGWGASVGASWEEIEQKGLGLSHCAQRKLIAGGSEDAHGQMSHQDI